MGVAVGRLDDLVGNPFQLFLNLAELTAHEAFDGIDSVARVSYRLPLGGLADQAFAGLSEGDDGRRRALTFGILEHHRIAAFHDGHARVGGAQINANYFCHKNLFLSVSLASSAGAVPVGGIETKP